MKRCALALLLAAFLLLPAAARAGLAVGVTEDAGKYSTDGGASFFARLHDLGMTENAVSIQWDPDRPTAIAEHALLDRMVPTASRYGIRIVFAVYFTRPKAITATPDGAGRFAAYLRLLARTYPQVKDFVIGNEPNYGVFWQPQFDADGKPAAGAAYESLLARSYDALKSVDPRIDVIGMGLAARGNDSPFSRAPSTSPVLFLRDVGTAYRRSGRTRPIMDALAYHPYPASSLASVDTTQGWPEAGVADLGRLKQAVWDAFHDTAQAGFENGLVLRITEIGWQAAVPPSSRSAYRGTENVRTTDEQTQARIYGQLVRQLACDPSVGDLLFFHLVDEADLRGFQSGLIRADGSARPAYGAVKSAIAETGGRCTGVETPWQHAESVVGASVGFAPPADGRGPAFVATAREGALYRATFARVGGTPTDAERDALERSLEGSGANVVSAGPVSADSRTSPSLQSPAEPGTYVQAVLLTAAADPGRSSFFVSPPFTVVPPSSVAPPPAEQSASGTDPAGGQPAKPAAPQESRFAVTSPGAKPRTQQAVRFKRHAPAAGVSVPRSADFRRLRAGSTTTPGTSDVSALDGSGARRNGSAARPRPTVAPRPQKSGLSMLFALFLAGAVASAAVAVRLVRR